VLWIGRAGNYLGFGADARRWRIPCLAFRIGPVSLVQHRVVDVFVEGRFNSFEVDAMAVRRELDRTVGGGRQGRMSSPFFNAAVQLRTIVTGAGSDGSITVLTRNRSPFAITAYCCRGISYGPRRVPLEKGMARRLSNAASFQLLRRFSQQTIHTLRTRIAFNQRHVLTGGCRSKTMPLGGVTLRSPEPGNQGIEWGTPAARWIVLATSLGSGIAFLDATVVNVALPAIGLDLDASVAGMQWIVNGYTLTLASLILIGGSLGDRFGRRRIFIVGVVWFAAASLLCGLAATADALVGARVLQGIGGALLIDVASWRFIFLINIPLAVAVVAIVLKHVPETRDPASVRGIDVPGAILTVLGLAGVTWSLIEAGERGISGSALAVGSAGLVSLAGFVALERHSRHPMLPLDIFRSRQFTAANIVTFFVYTGAGITFFLLVVHLQQVMGYSPMQAGLAMLPVTVLMLALSARAGLLADRIGPRLPMTAGPLAMAAGLAVLSHAQAGTTYAGGVLPGVLVFGLGLTLTVAPLTATVLAAADPRHAGIASGVNNAISRGAGLIAVAVIPGLAGLTGDAYRDPAVFASGFRIAMLISAATVATGGAVAWLLIRNDQVMDRDLSPAIRPHHCAVDAAPLASSRRQRLPS
jgi:MFS family permease